jgi:hypothetical protein
VTAVRRPDGRVVPVFRWAGHYWGFRDAERLYDRYGRQAGWIEPGTAPPDVYEIGGRFLGELVDDHYVLRGVLRAEPVHRAPRPPVPHPAPPDPAPDAEPREPRDGWTDALPWPLPPPEPPRL